MYRTLIISLWIVIASPAYPQSGSEQFAQCVIDNATPQDKSIILRVALIALSKNPELRSFAQLPENIEEVTRRDIADAVDRIVVSACDDAARKAISEDGTEGLRLAVRTFVEVSTSEALVDAQAQAAALGFWEMVDVDALRLSLSTSR